MCRRWIEVLPVSIENSHASDCNIYAFDGSEKVKSIVVGKADIPGHAYVELTFAMILWVWGGFQDGASLEMKINPAFEKEHARDEQTRRNDNLAAAVRVNRVDRSLN